jgi:hypothetical protein
LHVPLTSLVELDPYSEDFSKQEDTALKHQQGSIYVVESQPTDTYSESDNILPCVSKAHSQDAFLSFISSTIGSIKSKYVVHHTGATANTNSNFATIA